MARTKQRGPWIEREPGLSAWYIYWYDADARRVRRRSTGTADRQRAEEALGLWIIERARAEKPATSQSPDRYPVATALRWYLQEHAIDLESGPHIARAAELLLKFFGPSAMISAATPQATKRYERLRQEKGIKSGTIRYELSILSAAFNHAVKNGRLTLAPRIFRPPAGPSRTRHLDHDEIRRLLTECRKTRHLYLWAMLALNTAARKGALLELTWTQVQFEQGLIYLNPEDRIQTTKGRAIVPISAPLRTALTEAFERRSCPYVIEWGGGRVLDIKNSFGRACDRAGLEDVVPHTLRHTAATLMAQAGIDFQIIGKVLGHSVARVTEMYIHHKPEWLRGAVDALGRATAPSVTPIVAPRKPGGSPDGGA